jgi:ribonuclease HI
MEELTLYFDGTSKPNPGKAACGFLIFDGNAAVVEKSGRYIGVTTNNVAEYSGFIFGMLRALRHHPERLTICTDSLLLVKQIEGAYRVKDENLRRLHAIAKEILALFPRVTIRHVSHDDNKAHDLAQAHLEEDLF